MKNEMIITIIWKIANEIAWLSESSSTVLFHWSDGPDDEDANEIVTEALDEVGATDASRKKVMTKFSGPLTQRELQEVVAVFKLLQQWRDQKEKGGVPMKITE